MYLACVLGYTYVTRLLIPIYPGEKVGYENKPNTQKNDFVYYSQKG